MIRTMFTTVLLCVGVLFSLPVIGQWNQTPSFTLSRSDTSIEYMKVFRNINDCPPDVDECTEVTAPRISCPVGAVCTEGRPSSIPCVSGLTANPDAPISSPYGEERAGGPHNGIDIAVPRNTPVYAAKDGTVSAEVGTLAAGDRSTANGNYVRINYDDGTQGVFLHLLSTTVVRGARVSAGQQVGTSNDTGSSSGDHLHYTAYPSQNPRDRQTTSNPALIHSDC